MEFSLVVPVYNEAGNICPLLNEIRRALDGMGEYEVLFVDDGSTDDTIAELTAARNNGFTNLRVQHHHCRCGQSAAILTGVRAARRLDRYA